MITMRVLFVHYTIPITERCIAPMRVTYRFTFDRIIIRTTVSQSSTDIGIREISGGGGGGEEGRVIVRCNQARRFFGVFIWLGYRWPEKERKVLSYPSTYNPIFFPFARIYISLSVKFMLWLRIERLKRYERLNRIYFRSDRLGEKNDLITRL